jgi:hypothetical protein
MSCYYDVVRDCSVGIATRYRLDGPGIESQRGRDFPTSPNRPRADPTPSTMRIVAFPRVKWLRRDAHQPTPTNTQFKERAELYLYFPSGLSWPILGWTLPLPLPVIVTDSFRFHRYDYFGWWGWGDGWRLHTIYIGIFQISAIFTSYIQIKWFWEQKNVGNRILNEFYLLLIRSLMYCLKARLMVWVQDTEDCIQP